MKVWFIAFTKTGEAHAHRLAACLPPDMQTSIACGYGEAKVSHAAWARRGFAEADALVFVGAAGIAVRAIAPFVKSKATDPAVIVADEAGRWVVPLLSGHLGGANRLARRLAKGVDAQVVLTTTTDVRGVWAADDWAASRGMAVLNPPCIKGVSSRLLNGGQIVVATDVRVAGAPPAQVRVVGLEAPPAAGIAPTAPSAPACDVLMSPFAWPCAAEVLRIVPRNAVVGVGCRRDTGEKALLKAIDAALDRAHVVPQAVREVRSIDLKQDEAGLLAAAAQRGWQTRFFTADELAAVPGSFAGSDFVAQTTGVDNVCERAAAAGGAMVVLHKTVIDGITVAVALDAAPYSWNEEQ